MRSTPLYAPDGMTSAGSNHQQFVGTTAHERHDDGLVHNHAWAVSGNAGTVAMPASGGMSSTMAFAGSRGLTRFHGTVPAQDHYDDGLVHNHGWAVSGK